jgi:acyl-CoA thioesterase
VCVKNTTLKQRQQYKVLIDLTLKTDVDGISALITYSSDQTLTTVMRAALRPIVPNNDSTALCLNLMSILVALLA